MAPPERRDLMKIKLWTGQGTPPAPYVVAGRSWRPAQEFLAQAIRLGRTPQVVWALGLPARALEAAMAAFLKGVIALVLNGGVIPVRGRPVPVPGWAYWALDGLGPEAQKARERAWEGWLRGLLTAREADEGRSQGEEARPRGEWAHDVGRPAPSWGWALLRAWEEVRGEGVALPPLTLRGFVRALSQLLTGAWESRAGLSPKAREALEGRAVRLAEGGWFPPSPEGLGVSPAIFAALCRAAERKWRVGALAGWRELPREVALRILQGEEDVEGWGMKPTSRTYTLLLEAYMASQGEVVRVRVGKPRPRPQSRQGGVQWSLRDIEGAVARALQGEEDPALAQVLDFLARLGLEWPTEAGTPPHGISPLYWVLYWAQVERDWGGLAARLGTWNPRALAKARALQRLVERGLPLEEAAREVGVPVREARNVWALLHQGSVEEWTQAQEVMEAEAEGADEAAEPRMRTYEEVLAEEVYKRQVEALHLALEAVGKTAEEVLADPDLLAEVARLARAFYGEEEEQENPPPGGEAGGAGQANPSL